MDENLQLTKLMFQLQKLKSGDYVLLVHMQNYISLVKTKIHTQEILIMKNNSTKKHVRTGTILIAISLSLALINALVYAVIIYAPEIRSRKNIDGLEAKAVPVNDIYIPDDAVVIGLGEATHGNVEFQELKLQVLQETVERYDVGSISMELDFGTGIAIKSISSLTSNTRFSLSKSMSLNGTGSALKTKSALCFL